MSTFTISSCYRHPSKGWMWIRWVGINLLFQLSAMNVHVLRKLHEFVFWFLFLFSPRFRLFLWRNWSKEDFRTILISFSGLRSSLMPITMVKSMIRLQPDKVRMPFPHPTLVSRSLTYLRSPIMLPAPLLQVNLLRCTFFMLSNYMWKVFLDTLACFHIDVPGPLVRLGIFIFYITIFCDHCPVTSTLRTQNLCSFLWKSNCLVIIALSAIHPFVRNIFMS